MAHRKTRQAPKVPKISENSPHFPALIENAPVAIGISRKGVTFYGNKMYLKLFGFQSAEEIRGQSILDYWSPQSRAEIAERIRQRARGMPVASEYEAIAQRKDGSQFPVQVAVTVTELEDGPATAAFFWDLSDRKKAEESLRESEERFRKVFEVGPLAMVINSMDNRYLDANPAFCQLVGYSKEELANLTFLDLTHPEDLKRDLAMTDRVYAGEIPNFRIEKRYIRKDGKVVWVDLAGTVIRDREGKILYGLAMVEDITDWKHAEEALRLRERDLEEAQRLAQLGSWVWDVRTATVTWSRGMYHVTGRDPNLPPPQSQEEFQTVYPAETWARLDAAGLETLRTGVSFEIEAEIIASGGTRKWVISRAEAERDAEGHPIRLRGTVQDISERKRAETLLQASEERYRLLFERNLAGVIRTDMDGRVLECNNAFAKIHGYASREEVMAVNSRDFYFDDSSREALLRQLKRDKIVVGYESHARRKDGKAAWVLVSSSLIEAGPEGPTIQSTTFDITRWREVGEHLRQAQKMDAVGRLAGGVAHDFNNMLQIINGYSELLLEGIAANDPMREYVEEIKNSVDRSAGLTRQLLAFSRQQVLAPQILDLNKVIANSTRMVRRLIGDDIKLRVAQGTHLSPVKVDPVRIDQVILNLAINARDAMPKGGKLKIKTANLTVTEEFTRAHVPMVPGPYVLLQVTDTGIGMDADTQSHIFEPFFTTKDKGRGTGLGLATVYGIVKQSGGYIWVDSETKKGSTFSIYLPPTEIYLHPDQEQKLTVVPGGSETVLLVEDEKEVRALVRRVVGAKGYKVLEARNGTEALRVAKKCAGPIHLLLTDLVMHGMDGQSLAERLRALRPGIKVLFMSGYTQDAMARHGGLKPGSHLLQKPVSPDEMARKMREVLDAS